MSTCFGKAATRTVSQLIGAGSQDGCVRRCGERVTPHIGTGAANRELLAARWNARDLLAALDRLKDALEIDPERMAPLQLPALRPGWRDASAPARPARRLTTTRLPSRDREIRTRRPPDLR